MLKLYHALRVVSLVGMGLTGNISAADLLENNTFDETVAPWSVYTASAELAEGEQMDGKAVMHVHAVGENRWDVQLRHQGLTLEQNHAYTVRCTVMSSKATSVYIKIGQSGAPYNEYWNNGGTALSLNADEPVGIEQTFVMTEPTDPGVELAFHLGNGVAGEAPFDISFDDIYLDDPEYKKPAGELLYNNTFNSGSFQPWSLYTATKGLAWGKLKNNEYVVHVNNAGTDNRDIMLRFQNLTIEQGHTYTVKCKLRSSRTTQVHIQIGRTGSSDQIFWNNDNRPLVVIAGEDSLFERTFTMNHPTATECELAFLLGKDGGGRAPGNVYFDDIYLQDPDYKKDAAAQLPKPEIRLNQTGYFPKGRKRATILCTSTFPITWFLKDMQGDDCCTGTTTVCGYDSSSGDFVHIADFSSWTTPGNGYVLAAEKDGKVRTSHPFDISRRLYHDLKYQALAYFYHNRSGIAIEMPYAGSPEYTRPAGHPVDTMRTWPESGQADYLLDVSKGWYDAGDQGKYVVNGGISVWMMMNMYERTLHVRGAHRKTFGDGTLAIPENANKVPDILDEARWEMEMLLSMQVPDTLPYAGMAHHKGHDNNWTGLPTRPDRDPMTRYLTPVSTAATLNLAAVAAQSSRLWRHYDPKFSKKCLRASLRAWNAAKEHPDILASEIATGGGLYGDTFLEDEFYWAACELFVTTGSLEFRKFIKNSPFFTHMPVHLDNQGGAGYCGVFTWDNVQGLGTITLAMVPNFLHPRHIRAARRNIIAAADTLSSIKEHEGYLVPLKLNNGYEWGSNSFILNNCIISALAYDFTGTKNYRDDVTEGMDYIMGRNAMDKSYVSGYGERTFRNPHHRFWAHQANPAFPSVPAGVLSGGPNSALQDPYAQAIVPSGSPAQKCYVDHIESWSTNEVTINWNTPLAWVSAFIDEKFNRY